MILLLLLLLFLPFFLNAQIIHFPDEHFKALLVESPCVYTSWGSGNFRLLGDADVNDDGEIDIEEARSVKHLNFGNGDINVIDLSGLEYFVNLEILAINNFGISELNIDTFSNLKRIDLQNLTLNGFNVISPARIRHIIVQKSTIPFIHLEDIPALTYLKISNNNTIEKVILNQLPLIEKLEIQNNNMINSISMKRMRNMRHLYLNNNSLDTLELHDVLLVKELFVKNNDLKTLNCSDFYIFEKLDCSNNINLEKLYLNNGRNEQVSISGNIMLEFICVDYSERFTIRSLLEDENIDAEVSTNCTVHNNEEILEGIRILRNPTRQWLRISSNTTPQSLRVLDLNGRSLLQDQNTQELQVDHLAPGLYLLELTFSDGKRKTEKWIKL